MNKYEYKTIKADQSCHIILNILSPANYKEFKRMLVADGLVVKVVPRPNYLKELREALFYDSDKKLYKNDETVSLFKQHFYLLDQYKLTYKKVLKQIEMMNLVQMSPLAWNSKKEEIDRFINRGSVEITVDLNILIGINKQTGGDRT